MGVGKYSPTVGAAYAKNQNWWRENGGDNWDNGRNGNLDNDGFDSYGYSSDGPDRAGHRENEYWQGTPIGDTYVHELYERIDAAWTVGADGRPCHKFDVPIDGPADLLADDGSEVNRRLRVAKDVQAQIDKLQQELDLAMKGVYGWAKRQQDAAIAGKLAGMTTEIPRYRTAFLDLKHEIESEA